MEICRIRRGMVFWFDLDDTVNKNAVPPLKLKGQKKPHQNDHDYRQYGLRHWLVVSNNLGNISSPTCNIVPVTSSNSKSPLPTHVLFMHNREKLEVLCEQPTTVNSVSLQNYAFTVTPDTMNQVTHALAIQHGIIPPYPTGNINIQGSLSDISAVIELVIEEQIHKYPDVSFTTDNLVKQLEHYLHAFASH